MERRNFGVLFIYYVKQRFEYPWHSDGFDNIVIITYEHFCGHFNITKNLFKK